jgi:hypothetical protein
MNVCYDTIRLCSRRNDIDLTISQSHWVKSPRAVVPATFVRQDGLFANEK